MYGLSLVASMESLKGHERPLNPPRRQPSEPPAKNRVLPMKAGAVATMILVVPVLDTLL